MKFSTATGSDRAQWQSLLLGAAAAVAFVVLLSPQWPPPPANRVAACNVSLLSHLQLSASGLMRLDTSRAQHLSR
jgi:uncharacterized membrane protein YccC